MNYSCLEVIFKIYTFPIFLFCFWVIMASVEMSFRKLTVIKYKGSLLYQMMLPFWLWNTKSNQNGQ
jgi:hypothetical protein